jgi:hypothetical protein
MICSESAKVKFVSRDAEVFYDVGENPARDIARVPRKRDDSLRSKRVRIMPMSASVAQMNAADFFQPPFQSAAVERGIFAHKSSCEHKLVAEGRRNGAARFKQSLEMSFGCFLKTQDCLPAITPVGMAAGEQIGFCNPDPIFILPRLNLRDRNYHDLSTLNIAACAVNASRKMSLTHRFSPRKRSGVGIRSSALHEPMSTVPIIPIIQHSNIPIF